MRYQTDFQQGNTFQDFLLQAALLVEVAADHDKQGHMKGVDQTIQAARYRIRIS